LKKVEDPSMFGVAVLEDKKIVDLVEKPKTPVSSLALVGIYIFSPDIFRAVNNIKPSWRGELEITDALKYLLSEGRTVGYHILQEWWIDTGKKDDLLIANRLVLNDLIATRIDGTCKSSQIEGVLSLGKNSVIQDCKIKGPVCIDEDCFIAHCDIGPYVSIGKRGKIENTVIENSVIMERCSIYNLRVITKSLIGKNVEIVNNGEKDNSVVFRYKFTLSDDSRVEM